MNGIISLLDVFVKLVHLHVSPLDIYIVSVENTAIIEISQSCPREIQII